MNQNLSNKVAIIDIDGTIVSGQTQQGLINFFFKKKKLSLWYMVHLNLFFILYKLGIISDVKKIFEYGLVYLKGKSVTQIEPLVKEYINQLLKNNVYPQSMKLIDGLRNQGYKLVILSAAIDLIVSGLAKSFNIDDYICTRLEVESGDYTGKIKGKIIYGNDKVDAIKKYFESNNYLLKDAVAYADHKSDIPMLKIVGKSYIVNPSSKMKRVAQKEKIGIIYTK